MTNSTGNLRVAAVQAASLDGQATRNLDHAAPLVARAAQAGAELVLLPELYSSGFRMTREIWQAAEPMDGPTVCWLRAVSKQHDASFPHRLAGATPRTFSFRVIWAWSASRPNRSDCQALSEVSIRTPVALTNGREAAGASGTTFS